MKRFRHRNRTGQRSLPLLAILGICFAGALLLALLIGLILNAALDEETYYRLSTKPRKAVNDKILFVPDLPDVVAYPYAFGGDVAEAAGKPAVAVALNTKEGSYLYFSDVLTYFKTEKVGKTRLSTALSTFSEYHVYTSGIFYPQSQKEYDLAYRYAKESEETAALKEFFYLGGSEVILCGLDLVGRTERILDYVKSIKLAVGNNPVGVAVPYETLQKDENWKILEQLLTVCDFLALDLRDAGGKGSLDEALADVGYPHTQYHMRLLLSEAQTAWIDDARDALLTNYEILK